MRKHVYLISLFIFLVAATLVSCSRESSVKENVSLKNNHSRIFAQREPFEDPRAFADSMANTPVNSNDSLPDTLTVTINDTIYLMGLLPYNVDKVYRFQWNLTKSDGKDSIIIGDNATPQAWVYKKTGVYYPLFIAFDGNNSTDTAGTNTKQTYIKVIDTKPILTVPKDTLWTSNKGDITFPITVSDSFGTVKRILVDLDASGSDSVQTWKYETRENSDSLYISIKNNSKFIDSLGNQKIYIIAEDDDGNQTKDSVNLHFNRLPKLKILYPLDGARHNIAERFYFYYEGNDSDNPKDLRYFIYAQVSKNGQPPVKAFDSNDLIAENYTATIFEPTNSKGENAITLVNNPTKELSGRIYWDMYVTDGYDIVHMERVSTGSSSSRPWSFYIGDLKSTQGSISGVAQLQGRTDHYGINVELSNGLKTYSTTTDNKGYYTLKVDAGSYTVSASIKNSEYASDTLKDIYLESGIVLTADSMLLKDIVAPFMQVKVLDTITTRSFDQTIYVRDLGSRIKNVSVKLNGEERKADCLGTDQNAVYSCNVPLKDYKDGTNLLEYSAQDSAGNTSSLKQNFEVRATTLSLTVNELQKYFIGAGDSLHFKAVVGNAYPAADSIIWNYSIGATPVTRKTAVNEDGSAVLSLAYDDIKTIESGKEYDMTVSYKENNVNLSQKVRFGILGEKPIIIFTEPGLNTEVSMNDPVKYKVVVYRGNSTSGTMTVSWDCSEADLTSESSCPTAKDYSDERVDTEATFAFSTIKSHRIKVSVKDGDEEDSDSLDVIVIKDPPTVKVSTNERSNKFKINSYATISVNASDKFGTINKISWDCHRGSLSSEVDSVLAPPAKTLSNFNIKVQMPGAADSESDKGPFHCKISATDDDGEAGVDSLKFTVVKDPPSVKLAVKQDVVKIKSSQTIKASAYDTLGYITDYSYACKERLNSITEADWSPMSGSTVNVLMPAVATDYYCIVEVTDDDNLKARDTVTYKVIIGKPTVTAVLTPSYETVTIRDTIELNAIAHDSLGYIKRYEWGCGPASSDVIGFTYTSESTARAYMVMPNSPQEKYRCIIRVTDDDDNTAYDTVQTKVILAPPTIKVANDSLTVREGFNIALNAEAYDNNNVSSDPGSIIKREWSCGTPAEIEKKWKSVSTFDTVWKAPAPQATFYCVARVTDNDSTSVADTTVIKFSTQQPLIQARDDVIYINIGDEFSLSATVNDVWQGIDWFTWECVDKATGSSFEKNGTASKYDYKRNGGNMTVGKDTTFSMHKKNMYCIVSAQESSTKAVFKDTTEVRIMEQHPKGVISAADTVYLWSGEDNVSDEAIYFYTPEWGGMKSVIGELGDESAKYFRWKFSNGDNTFYDGNPDGSLDTNQAQFNSAFVRKTREGSMTITLDFRDSNMTENRSQAFLSRHQAEEVSRKIYFRKAWQNLATDTVLENVGKLGTAPALTFLGDNPVEAYLSSKTTIKVKIRKSGTWSEIGSVDVTDSVTSIKLASDGKNLYVGALLKTGSFVIYKSINGTSALAKNGNAISNVSSPKLLCHPSSGELIVVYINASDKLNYMARLASSTWSSTQIAGITDTKFRELDAEFLANGNLAIVAVDVSSDYRAYSSLYSSTFEQKIKPTLIGKDINKITLASSVSNIYLGFSNRDVDKYGPYVYAGTIGASSISWNKSGVYGSPIFEGYIAYHMSIAVNNGVVYAALDDNGWADYSQIHVFKLEGGKWHFYGENELPYFKSVFYNINNYYLRGSNPQLAIDGAGKVHLSMLARENAGGRNKNNGPIIMKYVADNWEIHE